MVDCGPSCAVPSVASLPTVGFGSAGGLGYGSLGHGFGRFGSGFGGLGSGFGSVGYGFGGAERAANLGILDGVIPKPINQTPPAEVVIQPSPIVLTLPGPILSASCEPVGVGGNTPCAVGGSGLAGGYGFGSRLLGSNFGGYLGQRRGGLFGIRAPLGRRGSVCI